MLEVVRSRSATPRTSLRATQQDLQLVSLAKPQLSDAVSRRAYPAARGAGDEEAGNEVQTDA